MASLGPYSDAVGLTELNLVEQLCVVAQDGVNNGQAYEIMKYVQRVKLPWRQIRTAFPEGQKLTDQQFLSQLCSSPFSLSPLLPTDNGCPISSIFSEGNLFLGIPRSPCFLQPQPYTTN